MTPVHATLVPDIILPTARMAPNLSTSDLLSGKSHTSEQENLNPLMNTTPSMFNSLPPIRFRVGKGFTQEQPIETCFPWHVTFRCVREAQSVHHQMCAQPSYGHHQHVQN